MAVRRAAARRMSAVVPASTAGARRADSTGVPNVHDAVAVDAPARASAARVASTRAPTMTRTRTEGAAQRRTRQMVGGSYGRLATTDAALAKRLPPVASYP